MPLLINLRHLETGEMCLQGELPLEELDLERIDELMRPVGPLQYDLTVERLEKGLLIQGRLELGLACECARCLRPFHTTVELQNACALLPWEGEDAVPIRHDCADLTPHLREDIVLALPQRPLCEPECGGLGVRSDPSLEAGDKSGGLNPATSAWATLNQLKL
jgi:uncharacterized metal-binding protein YceD (DUF177 family)